MVSSTWTLIQEHEGCKKDRANREAVFSRRGEVKHMFLAFAPFEDSLALYFQIQNRVSGLYMSNLLKDPQLMLIEEGSSKSKNRREGSRVTNAKRKTRTALLYDRSQTDVKK